MQRFERDIIRRFGDKISETIGWFIGEINSLVSSFFGGKFSSLITRQLRKGKVTEEDAQRNAPILLGYLDQFLEIFGKSSLFCPV